MSRTDKDLPYWYISETAPDTEVDISHARNCKKAELHERWRYESPEHKTEKRRVPFYKFTDSLGNVFWARERTVYERVNTYRNPQHTNVSERFLFDPIEHPDAKQKMRRNGPELLYAIKEFRTVEVPVSGSNIAEKVDYSEDELVDCDLDAPGRRYKTRCHRWIDWYSPWASSHHGTGRKDPLPLRAERRLSNQRMTDYVNEYNSNGELDDNERSYASNSRYDSLDRWWYWY